MFFNLSEHIEQTAKNRYTKQLTTITSNRAGSCNPKRLEPPKATLEIDVIQVGSGGF